MKIEYQKGDMIAAPEIVLVHGCNAQGVMGRGVALAIKTQLPFAFKAYRDIYDRGMMRLGDVVWAINQHRIVGNAITQEHWEKRHAVNGMNVNLDAVRSCVRQMDEFAWNTQQGSLILPCGPVTRIAMPKIGAGLGGGDWNSISYIIETESVHFTPVVYVLE